MSYSNRAHVISPLRSLTYPTRLICWSVEPWICQLSDGRYDHTFRLAHLAVCSLQHGQVQDVKRINVYTHHDLWEELWHACCHDRKTWAVAPVLGYCATLANFWQRLSSGAAYITWAVLTDPPTILDLRRKRQRLRMVALENYLREPAYRLADDLGLPWSTRPERDLTTQEAMERCRQRVHLTEVIVCTIMKELSCRKLCGFGSTAASLAFRAWRTSYNDSPISTPDNPAATSLARAGLFGGQLMISKRGAIQQPVIAADVNSLYPWIASTNPLPCRLMAHLVNPQPLDVRMMTRDYWCVARVTARPMWPTPWRCSPRHVEDHTDEREYVLCGSVLSHFAACGCIQAVYAMSAYHLGHLFKNFVRDLYAARLGAKLRGDVVASKLWKLLLNSLFGKFAQQGGQWEHCPNLFCARQWGEWFAGGSESGTYHRYRALAGSGQIWRAGSEPRDSFPAITAAVNELGRFAVHDLVETAHFGETFYTDTDCLHVSQQGWKRLLLAGVHDQDRLGGVKVVAEGPDAFYWSAKHYRVGNHYVSNVIRPSAVEIAEGLFLSQSTPGVLATFHADSPDHVMVRDRLVHLTDSHERPLAGGCKREEDCHGQAQTP